MSTTPKDKVSLIKTLSKSATPFVPTNQTPKDPIHSQETIFECPDPEVLSSQRSTNAAVPHGHTVPVPIAIPSSFSANPDMAPPSMVEVALYNPRGHYVRMATHVLPNGMIPPPPPGFQLIRVLGPLSHKPIHNPNTLERADSSDSETDSIDVDHKRSDKINKNKENQNLTKENMSNVQQKQSSIISATHVDSTPIKDLTVTPKAPAQVISYANIKHKLQENEAKAIADLEAKTKAEAEVEVKSKATILEKQRTLAAEEAKKKEVEKKQTEIPKPKKLSQKAKKYHADFEFDQPIISSQANSKSVPKTTTNITEKSQDTQKIEKDDQVEEIDDLDDIFAQFLDFATTIESHGVIEDVNDTSSSKVLRDVTDITQNKYEDIKKEEQYKKTLTARLAAMDIEKQQNERDNVLQEERQRQLKQEQIEREISQIMTLSTLIDDSDIQNDNDTAQENNIDVNIEDDTIDYTNGWILMGDLEDKVRREEAARERFKIAILRAKHNDKDIQPIVEAEIIRRNKLNGFVVEAVDEECFDKKITQQELAEARAIANNPFSELAM